MWNRTVTRFSACAVVVIAGLGALRLPPVRETWLPLHSAHIEAEWSESEIAKKDHERVVYTIKEMCSSESPVLLASTRGTTASAILPGALTTFQAAATNYSDELKDLRIRLDREIRADQARIWWFQVGIVLFGALATIVVGLKPLCERLNINYANTAAAAGAIIFSAVVTSLSSLSAITTSQTDVLHHQRTLAQLQQLHWRINNDVFAATELCNPISADLGKIGSWKDRFEAITNEAMLSIIQPGDVRPIGPDSTQPPKTTTASR